MRKGRCSIVTSDPLGCQIKARLAECGGICELARVAGVREATIYSWIKGDTRPTGDHLERLAAALHTTPEELLGAYRHPGHLTLDQVWQPWRHRRTAGRSGRPTANSRVT